MNTLLTKICWVLFPLIVFVACKEEECPPDEYLGRAFLAQESIAKLPEPPGERVIYTNEEGKEISFWSFGSPFFSDPLWVTQSVGQICNRRDSDSYYLMDLEEVSGRYELYSLPFESQLTFYFSLRIINKNIQNPVDTFLVDELSISGLPSFTLQPTAGQPASLMNLITSYRHNPNPIEEEIVLLDEVTLLEKKFSEVYSNTNGLLKIYYNFEFGIVAFEDLEEKLWVLDRFE